MLLLSIVLAFGIADMINYNQFITLPYIEVKVILKSRVTEAIAVQSPQASEVDWIPKRNTPK